MAQHKIRRKAKRPAGYRRLLTIGTAKTKKGEKLGYLTGILHLAPSDESGVMNTCGSENIFCKETCIIRTGRLVFERAKKSRVEKTLLLFHNRALFLECLRWDIGILIRRARKLRMRPAVRVNGTSDLAWLAIQMCGEFPKVQFYDYTKHKRPELRIRPNYALTFSYSGTNLAETLDAMSHGVNVAVVFNTKRNQPLPETWNGRPVIDGDLHDLRFLDPAGCVVGLRAKGNATKLKSSPFVVLSNNLCAVA